MFALRLVVFLATAAGAVTSITALPSQTSTSVYSASGQATLSQISYTYSYTVTTATTSWAAPTFARGIPPSPFPTCSSTMCPSLNGMRCVDTLGDIYGVLCDVRFSGVVITTSGKKMLKEREGTELERKHIADADIAERDASDQSLEKRTYAGSFNTCAMACGAYNRTLCPGLVYEDGYCMAYDKIQGSFNSPGFIAALRQ